MLGLLLVVLPILGVKDPKKKVTAHPLVIIAQISLLQSFLYFYMDFANLKVMCWVIDHSWIQPLLEWIPIKSQFTYHKLEPGVDPKTVTFRLIWAFVHEFVSFIGLIQLILSFFFLIDMIMTWRHPIKYISSQKKMITIFITSSKVLQILTFIVLS